MDIGKIIGIGLIGTILTITVKGYRPELGMGVAIATGIVIFMMLMPELQNTLGSLYALCENSGLDTAGIKLVVKIIGIAYITQFSAELARDVGERAISKKLELAGKLAVLTLMLPIAQNLIDILISTLMNF